MSCLVPTVSGRFGEKPHVVVPPTSAPKELVMQVIKTGDGPEIHPGDVLSVHYQGQTWDGRVFDSSYDRGSAASFPIGVGAVIAGWDEALVGLPVGSRVLVIVPPHEGYGTRGMPRAGITGKDVLVFSIDLLGVDQHRRRRV